MRIDTNLDYNEPPNQLISDAKVPSNVYALNLPRLSSLVGCTKQQLLKSIHTEHAVEMQGVVVEAGDDVPFEAIELRTSDATYANVHHVVVTTGHTTTCLLQVGGGQTILQHILHQLYLAQMEHIVIVVGRRTSSSIRRNVRDSPVYSKLKIEFVDIAEDDTNPENGYLQSVLAVKGILKGKPFLLHAADHVFDNALLTRLCSLPLQEGASYILVETNYEKLIGSLPPNAVKVKLSTVYVDDIGRDVKPYDGVSTGLFIAPDGFFDFVETRVEKSGFCLHEALNILAKEHLLRYITTEGSMWFGFETKEELAYSKTHEGNPILAPWTVFLARSPRSSTPGKNFDSPMSMILGVASPKGDKVLRVADKSSTNKVFSGFVVDVDHVGVQHIHQEKTPLLKKLSSCPSGTPTFEESDPFVLSIPWEERQLDERIDNDHEAFLLDVGKLDKETNTVTPKYMLAVPDMVEDTSKPSLKRKVTTLPSDITNVHLETTGVANNLEVTVIIDRSVPFVGYILLLSALFAFSSVGVANDMQTNVKPLLKLFWRVSATSAAFLPFACVSIYQNGAPRLTNSHLLTLFYCSFSFIIFNSCFLISLEFTSIGHACIFSNCHSILIVFGKMMLGNPIVILEGIGAGFSLIGGIATTFDTGSTAGNVKVTLPSVKGDAIALLAAIGGVFYLTFAKALRSVMDLPVFMFCITFAGSFFLIIMMTFLESGFTFDSHINTGVLGWVYPVSTRLPIELHLVYVCSFVGTMGFVSVMKYFDPIVISVVMLTEPVVATLLGIIVGVATWPGAYTYLGAFFVFFGSFLVIYSGRKKHEEINATTAVRHASDANASSTIYGTNN